MLASCESKLGFERQYDIFEWKRGPATREQRSARREVLGCTSVEWKRRVPNLCCGALMGLRSVQTSGGAPKRGGGVRSAERNYGMPIHAEEHWLGLRSTLSMEKRWKGEGWVSCVESNIGAPVAFEERPTEAEERRNGGIKHEMK